MKHRRKLLLFLLLALATVFVLTVLAYAGELTGRGVQTQSTAYLEYDPAGGAYVEKSAQCLDIAQIPVSPENGRVILSEGWYVANGEVSIPSLIEVSGTANLILADNAVLTALNGIHVTEGNSLNIFAQSDGSGTLLTRGKQKNAGIGGNEGDGCPSGAVAIHGGTVIAHGNYGAAGIGGGRGGSNGPVTVYGGEVSASGSSGAAGIGGGSEAPCGQVTLCGGTVTATGGSDGAGIGGGSNGDGGTVTVNGGTVTATGGSSASGIGGGCEGDGGTVTVNSGTVTATAGEDAAGIGGGYCGDGGSLTINTGKVTAIGNGYYSKYEYSESVGHGTFGFGQGTLTVGDESLVMGGDNEKTAERLEAPYGTRPLYMSFEVSESEALYSNYLEYDPESKEYVEKEAKCSVLHDVIDVLHEGFYLVEGEVTVQNRIEIDGEVKLILADGAKLNAAQGIHLIDDNALIIYGQTEGTGELIARSPGDTYSQNSGIGWNGESVDDKDKVSGPLTIHGGKIRASGNRVGVAIGGTGKHGGPVTIYGGTVGAPGDYSNSICGTVSIYNGTVNASSYYFNDGINGTVTIYGGTVTSTNVGYGTGISGTVTIYGGTVTSTSNSYGSGISGNVTIYDGKVTANSWGGNGIGGTVTIHGGNITAKGGEEGGAGIGGDVTIHGGTVRATGGAGSAGIGGSYRGNGGTVTIYGGTVTANAGSYGAGIGGGRYGSGGNVSIYGGIVIAYGFEGIGRGEGGADSGTLTVGENIVVKGGRNASTLQVIEAPYETRNRYFRVAAEPNYSFIWSLSGATPSATLRLQWDTGKVEKYTATVTTSEEAGTITYTASAVVYGTSYSEQKTVN